MKKITPFGDTAVNVCLGNEIREDIWRMVMHLAGEAAKIPGVIEVCPGYCAATVHYAPEKISYTALKTALEDIETAQTQGGTGRLVTIPVCYGGEYGTDLPDLAQHCGMSTEQVIEIHSSREYPVYMLGFTPGFPYLGGMDARIAMPRLKSPRVKIPGGSVGIAGEQTGIYPVDSPGGWRLIGRTPLRLFTPEKEEITVLQAGDKVRFEPITPEEYERIAADA